MDAYIIFGMGPAGLFLARQLKWHESQAIVAIGKKDDIGRYSNTLERYYATEDVEGIKRAVEETLQHYGQVTPYICSDQYLSIFFEQWPEIFELLHFSCPSLETLRLFADKESVMDYCQRLGMRVPKGELLSTVRFEDTSLAIKPLVKRGVSQMGKITVIKNGDELEAYKNKAVELGERLDDFIVQPFIEGNNRFEYGYGGFFKEGKAMVDVCFYQLRQYPQGVSCYTLEVTDGKKVEDIRNAVKAFMEKTLYSGFLQFDIKEDETTGLMYVLDINPRPWGSISMLESKLNRKGELWSLQEDSLPSRWRFPLKEIFSFRNKMNVPYSEIRKIRGDRKYKKLVDLYDMNDAKPFFMQPIVTLMKLLK